MAEEITAAHGSTQQPVSRQRADSDHTDKRLFLPQWTEVIRLGDAVVMVARPGNDQYEKNTLNGNEDGETQQNRSGTFSL